jgi:cyclopropane fatty-acyl-phospholipid synthase-like methyltransferase
MPKTEHHQKEIEDYDSADPGNSQAIQYGYWDKKVKTFPQSLERMKEVMMEAAAITAYDKVLDAGCGAGSSCIFLALNSGCKVTGITWSETQAKQATINARERGVEALANFEVMNYGATSFPAESFDVIWGCESICYADDKQKFVREAFRLLKPGGRLVVADGFVTKFVYNDRPAIRKWLDGRQIKYLESPTHFDNILQLEGFGNIEYRNISKYVAHSSRRLLKIYFLTSFYRWRKALGFSNKASGMQQKNFKGGWQQYWGLKQNLWQYGLVLCKKP